MPNSATNTLLVNSDNTIYEYTLAGTLVNTFTVPKTPHREDARDLVMDQEGQLHVFNGTFDPFLSSYDAQRNTWTHQTYQDWGISNNGSYGGITTYQNYVYLADMLGSSEGIIRVNLNDGSSQQVIGGDFIDLAIGLDNKLYGLERYGSVTIYDPLTLEELDSFKLSHTGGFQSIAVNASGDMFFGASDGQLHHYGSDQSLVKSFDTEISSLRDMDLAPDGTLIIGTSFGQVVITDESFSTPTSFLVDSEGAFVAFNHQSSDSDGGNEPETPGTVSGMYWVDRDRDGIQDESETGRGGQVVYLDINDNGQRDLNEPSTVTNAQGEYEFLEVTPGTYSVTLDSSENQVDPTPDTAVLIPVTNYRDLIYDASKEVLYLTTDDGDVERFSLTDQQLLSPLDIGIELNGGDITADGAFLFVAEEETGNDQGTIYKVNLNTNAVESLSYELDFGEGGAWDVSLSANGTGFVSTLYNGSGWTPIRELNPDTGLLTILEDANSRDVEARGKTKIHRSGDRSTLFFPEPNSSAGPMFVYDAGDDRISAEGETDTFLGNVAAVNRDGSILALPLSGGITLYDPDLFVLETLDTAGRIAFDPTKDILYVANSSVDQVIAFNTTSWEELYRFDVEGGVKDVAPFYTFDQGMTVSDDGQFLFVPTDAGIRAFEVGDYRLQSQTVQVFAGDNITGVDFQGFPVPNTVPSIWFQNNSFPRREGYEISFNVGFFDDDVTDRHIITIEWGDGTVEEFRLEEGDRILGEKPHIYSQDGTYTRIVTINDGHGDVVLDRAEIEVENVAPIVEAQGSRTGLEDEAYRLVLAAADPGDDTVTFTVDWGDNILESFKEGGEKRHVYADPGEYDVVITADDGTDTTEKNLRVAVSKAVDPEIPLPKSPVEDTSNSPSEQPSAPTQPEEPSFPNMPIDNPVDTDMISEVVFAGDAAPKPEPIKFNQGKKGLKQRGGTQGDRLKGSAQNDVFKGLKGDDRLHGNGGNDKLVGGSGDDVLLGGSGNDKLLGGRGEDVLKGGKGDDYLLGGHDGDRLLGGNGNDVLAGGKGADVLTGGRGQDVFEYKRLKEGGDTITDFDPDSDLINLTKVFAKGNYTAPTAAEQLNQFVQLIQIGSNTEIKVDVDGNGDRSEMISLATLNNVSAPRLGASNFILG